MCATRETGHVTSILGDRKGRNKFSQLKCTKHQMSKSNLISRINTFLLRNDGAAIKYRKTLGNVKQYELEK